MASIVAETAIAAPAEAAWALLADFGAADRAFPGILTACTRDGDIRTVTFAGGNEIRERLVDLDPARRRVAYGVIGGRFLHHSASMQIVEDGPGRCRFVWITDLLPDQAAPFVRELVEQGSAIFRRVAEGG